MSKNRYVTVLASTARTVLQAVEVEFDSGDNPEALVFSFDLSTDGGCSITPRIDGFDPLSETWTTILTGAAVAAVGFVQLKIGPQIVTAANLAQKHEIPSRVRFGMAVGDASSMTYTIGLDIINK